MRGGSITLSAQLYDPRPEVAINSAFELLGPPTKTIMRILHSNVGVYPTRGGPPAVIANVAAAQARAGHEVTVLTIVGPDSRPGATREMLTGLEGGGRVAILEHSHIPQLSWFLKRTDPLLGWQGDIVHCHELWNPFDWAVTDAAFKRGTPYAVTPHGIMSTHRLGKGATKKRIARVLWVDRMLRGACMVQALTQYESEELTRLIPDLRVATVANGYSLAASPSHTSSLPTPIGNSPFVLFMSRLEPMKGTEVLISSFSKVLKSHPEMHLVVAGPDYGAQQKMQAQCERLLINDRVHFVGMVQGPLKRALLEQATAFALPSKDEGFSIAILEAMAHGCAVVITPECRFPEAARAKAALEVAGNADEFSKALLHLIDDEGTRVQLGNNAKALIENEYTWDSIAAQLIDLYGHRCTKRNRNYAADSVVPPESN